MIITKEEEEKKSGECHACMHAFNVAKKVGRHACGNRARFNHANANNAKLAHAMWGLDFSSNKNITL